VLLRHGSYPSPVNLNGDRPLQECYRQHEALMSSKTQQDSLYATKRAALNSHPMSDLQEGPGLAGQSGFNSGLDGGNFGFVNSNRGSANSDYVNNPRDGKNWEPV